MIPYWIQSTLAGTLVFVWIYIGLGLPWALALLPRTDWRQRAFVGAMAFAAGPTLLTALMFLLSVVGQLAGQPLLRFDLIFIGTLALAIGGMLIVRRRARAVVPLTAGQPLAWDERLLIVLIAIALLIRWLGVAYWPFTAYDALWVYGYEGRLYTLAGQIPASIGYYPQFLPLQFTYAQLAIGGIDDHVARAALPFLHLGSILAAFSLGAKLFTRRTGLFLAAIWALYPHVGEWSRFGDLEIPLTFLFTLAAAFFLLAWAGEAPRHRYALLAGLVFGAAMWTKPTAGAFALGVALMALVEGARVWFNWRAWRPRLEVAVIAGLASLPLGGAWYIRNLLLGHSPIDFPPPFWLTQAQRSGVELGWPLLALLILLAYLYFARRPRPNVRSGVVGLALVLFGAGPSILWPHRLGDATWLARAAGADSTVSTVFGVAEWLLLLAGIVLLARTLLTYARRFASGAAWQTSTRVGWALLLAVPYFIVWFWSYSYHYRLSFAIVPLLILPIAVILAAWLPAERTQRLPLAPRTLYALVLALASFPGIIAPLNDPNAGSDWLWSGEMPGDFNRYESGNPALMNVVAGLQAYVDEHGEPPVVVAPGVERLPFFFPLADIRVHETPTRFEQLHGVDYFIDSFPEGNGEYEDIPLLENQVLMGLNRSQVARLAWGMDDGIFRYQVYELFPRERFAKPFVNVEPAEGDVIFGDFVRLMGHDLGGSDLWLGREVIMNLYWQVLRPPAQNYGIFIHLRDRDGNLWAAWDGPVAPTADGRRFYTPLVWDEKEYIVDRRVLELTDPDTPLGEGYTITVGFYDLQTNERVPVNIGGKVIADGYTLSERIVIVPAPEE